MTDASGSDDSVPLRVYLERRIDDQERSFAALRAADEQRYQQTRQEAQIALNAALTTAEKAVRAALDAAKEAVVKAEIATEKRLESLNELRRDVAMVADVRAVKDTATVEFRGINEKMGDLKARLDKLEATKTGRDGGLRDYIGWIIAALTIASSVIGFALLLRK